MLTKNDSAAEGSGYQEKDMVVKEKKGTVQQPESRERTESWVPASCVLCWCFLYCVSGVEGSTSAKWNQTEAEKNEETAEVQIKKKGEVEGVRMQECEIEE